MILSGILDIATHNPSRVTGSLFWTEKKHCPVKETVLSSINNLFIFCKISFQVIFGHYFLNLMHFQNIGKCVLNIQISSAVITKTQLPSSKQGLTR